VTRKNDNTKPSPLQYQYIFSNRYRSEQIQWRNSLHLHQLTPKPKGV
jgi:hypothetical protein